MGKSGKTYRRDGRTSYWIAKLQAGPLSEADRRRFEAWRAAHPSHHAAVERLLRELRLNPRQGQGGSIAAGSRRSRTAPASRSQRSRLLGKLLPRLFFVTLAALLAAVFWTGEESADYRTAAGAQASFALNDGSVVFMNTDTALNVTDDGARRRLMLLRGEADIIIAGAAIPMEVTVASAKLSAVEGRLLLRQDRRGITLAMVDGSALLRPSGNGGQVLEIKAGRTVILSADGKMAVPSSETLETMAAWQEGAVVFEALPLDQALYQVGRYREGVLVVLNPRLAKHEVLGRYSLKDPDALLARLLRDGGGEKLDLFGYLTLVY